jgi:hypothetical protein
MKSQYSHFMLLLLIANLQGCAYWLGPNNVSLRGLHHKNNGIVVDGMTPDSLQAGRLYANWSSEYEEIHFKKLQKNTTYCFWISRPILKWNHGFPEFAPANPVYSEFHKKLELTMLDKFGNILKYNDEYTELDTNDYDTIAFIRYRTTGVPKYDEVYLKISMCEDQLKGLKNTFAVHVFAYPTPNDMAEKYFAGSIPETGDRAQVDHLKLAELKPVFWHGFSHLGHGHAYGIWKEWCAVSSDQIDDKIECMVHNFEPFWFIPDTDGYYNIKLSSAPGKEFPESLALSVFHDSEFDIQNYKTDGDPDDKVKQRGVAICDDTGTGLRMIGSGKHLNSTDGSIFAGEGSNKFQGIPMMQDSVYYILVSAPRGQSPACSLMITNQVKDCPSDNPFKANYFFPCSLTTKLGPTPTSAAEGNLDMGDLSRCIMESNWSDYCWFDIASSEASVYRFEIRSTFEGKISIYTYGDAIDLKSYRHLKSRIFGYQGQDEAIKFDVKGDILRQGIKVVVYGKPCIENDSIFINMIPINFPLGKED